MKMDMIVDRNKEMVCEEKNKRSIGENPWNVYYACEPIKSKFEILKVFLEADPDTFEYAILRLKQNVGLAIFFLERGGSYFLVSKHLRNKKKVAMIAVKRNPLK